MQFDLGGPPEGAIDARPNKELFVEMITRDVTTEDAIMDFVDNSVDQASKAARSRTDGLAGLEIEVEVSTTAVTIEDNCGGMDIQTARERAFRFGRSPDVQPDAHSIGRFGIGMKRAFFKLGGHSDIYSKTSVDSFRVTIDVAEWISRPTEWSFQLVSPVPPFKPDPWKGYRVAVTNLHAPVKLLFHENGSPAPAIRSLMRQIRQSHQSALAQGLSIKVNGEHLIAEEPEVLYSEQLKPGVSETVVQIPDRKPVRAKVVVGLGKREPQDAGWYLFCNGRLVVRADKSIVTGWGESADNTIPRYHNDYARFRGFVFLDSADPDLLPWNTAKSGINIESAVFIQVRPIMLEKARPVFGFLREIVDEAQGEDGTRATEAAINRALPVKVNVFPAQVPVFPTSVDTGPSYSRITYMRLKTKVDDMKKVMNATSAKEVGETSFEYYYKYEIGEDE